MLHMNDEEFFLLEGHHVRAAVQLHLSAKEVLGVCCKGRSAAVEELSDTFSDHDNYMATRELLLKEHPNLQIWTAARKKPRKGHRDSCRVKKIRG